FCRASASENTSRPQPFAVDIGVRKKPSAERGPKLTSEMRQPHSTIRAGTRQADDPAVDGCGTEDEETVMTANASLARTLVRARSDAISGKVVTLRRSNLHLGLRARLPKRNLVRASIRFAHNTLL